MDSIVTDGLRDDHEQRQVIKGILEYIQSKKYTFQVLLGNSGDANFEKNILTFFGERIFHKEHLNNISVVKKAYQYIYASTGSFGLIYYWIMNEDVVEIDTMAEWIAGFNQPHLKA